MPPFLPRTRLVAVVPALVLGVFLAGMLPNCSSTASSETRSPSDIASERPVAIVHEPCAIDSQSAQRSMANGVSDVVSVREGGREVCRALDLNLDGRMDRFIYFDSKGQVRRIESDYDRDGRLDEVSVFKDGVLVRKDREMNLDGKIDTWDVFGADGKLLKRERDADGDGRVDEWWSFPDPAHPECAVIARDNNGDGKPDVGSQIDMCHPEADDSNGAPAGSAASSAGSVAPAMPPAAAASSAPRVAPSPAPSSSSSAGSHSP